MKKEDILILKSGADLLINSVSQSINSKADGREEGRKYIKKILDAIDELDKIKVKE